MQFGCCGKENSSRTQLSDTQLRGEVGATLGRRGCFWNRSQLSSAAWFSWSALRGKGKGSPFQRAELTDRHLHEGLVLFMEGRRMRLGGWVSPFGEGELFTSLKFRNAERSQLLWTSLWAGDDQALKFPTPMWRLWHVVLETVAFPHLTALIWLTSWQKYPKCTHFAGGWWFFPKWGSKQFTSFGCSGSAHWGKLPLKTLIRHLWECCLCDFTLKHT